MPKVTKRALGEIGLPPGTLVYTGEKKMEKVNITVIDYDGTQFKEKR